MKACKEGYTGGYAEAYAKDYVEGFEEGELAGRIRMLQMVLGLVVDPVSALATQPKEQLES